MNDEEIKIFLKEKNKQRLQAESLNDFVKNLKKTDFNENLKTVGFLTDKKIWWQSADRDSECFYCGLATKNYCTENNVKKFACSKCVFSLHEKN